MCGIFGLIYSTGGIPENLTKNSLIHRGPDGTRLWSKEGVFLRHTRLAINDIEGGFQPFESRVNGADIVTLVNGEIFNYFELKEFLISRGVVFKTFSDCEVVHLGYIFEGIKFFDRLNGIFAIAIWDSRKNSVVLVRDSAGVKPLYYFQDDNRIIFSSEIKGIIIDGGVEAKVKADAIPEYLFYRYVRSSFTFFSGVEKLKPGEILEIGKGKKKSKFISEWPKKFSVNFFEKRIKFNDALKFAIRSQQLGEVKKGVFLSGGLDSSVICALSAIYSNSELNSYCVEFEDYPNNSEADFARAVAERFGTHHRTVCFGKKDILPYLARIIWHYDEPCGDAAVIPTFLISGFAKADGVKVIFAGEGADELFGGYDKYKTMVKAYQSGIRNPVNLAEIWQQNISVFDFIELSNLGISREQIEKIKLQLLNDFNKPEMLNTDSVDEFFQHLLNIDQTSMLPENYLMKADKMTSAHGLEERVPYLDRDVVAFAKSFGINDVNLHYDGKIAEKAILKDLYHTILPMETIIRKKKGYGTPTKQWFEGWLGDIFEARLNRSEILSSHTNLDYCYSLLKDHRAGVRNNNTKLWSLFALDLWHLVYIKGIGRELDYQALLEDHFFD